MNHLVDRRAVKLGISGHAVDSVPASAISQLGSSISFRASERISDSRRRVENFIQVAGAVLVRIADDEAAVGILDRQDVDAGFQDAGAAGSWPSWAQLGQLANAG